MLTKKELRDTMAAYHRGMKSAMEQFGDGAMRLHKKPFAEGEERFYSDLSAWLCWDNYNIRPPGVCENLFRLSDYLSGRLPVPPREVLLFLHAYIFALEDVSVCYQQQMAKERKSIFDPKRRRPPTPKPHKPIKRIR